MCESYAGSMCLSHYHSVNQSTQVSPVVSQLHLCDGSTNPRVSCIDDNYICFITPMSSAPVPAGLCDTPLAFRLPPGAALVSDLLSAEEEEHILSQLSWSGDGGMKHRQVRRAGIRPARYFYFVLDMYHCGSGYLSLARDGDHNSYYTLSSYDKSLLFQHFSPTAMVFAIYKFA